MGASVSHFGLLTEKQKKLLKPLKSAFTKEQSTKGDWAMAQLAFDDNMFNSLTAVLTSIDRTFGVRDMMKGNPKAKPFLQMLTTSTVGKVLPQFIEDYGEDKKLDVHFSPSHALFVDGMPGSKMTGVYIDKNGNWKFQANIVMNLNVERTPGTWESAREVYLTIVFKMKMKQDDSNPFNKKLSVTPRGLEISQLKVLKGTEEMTVEQTMIQSMANLQMEALKKSFKEIPVSIGDIVRKNPKELACLGFNLSDLDLSFAKGFAQLSAYYKDANPPSKEVCDKFLQDLKNAPEKIQS